VPNPSVRPGDVVAAWEGILCGNAPMLSIEITRECPLSCPGCYAYGDSHLGNGVTLRGLNDLRGNKLVEGVLRLVRRHKPLHVSLVGGEPMVRHRELCRILPALSGMNIFTLVVTSGVIRVPPEWMNLSRVRVTVSVDGLPEHHDTRRKPATYERILESIRGCRVNVHWVITRPMLERPDYLEDYAKFWTERSEVERIWVSTYTPQVGEKSSEMLAQADRERLARELPPLAVKYPKLLFKEGMGRALLNPPKSPEDCLFAKLSANYSADLKTRVEPCVFGGTPDCSQCGCAASNGLHWVRGIKIAGPIRIGHFIAPSIKIGRLLSHLRSHAGHLPRWSRVAGRTDGNADLIKIQS